MTDSTQQLEIVEVAPRDGFQSVGPMIPTLTKITVIEQLYAAGIRRMETTSFVSDRALPQMSDATDIVAAGARLPQLDAQVLVPTGRQAERALAAGARHLSAVLSVSERHNLGNVRRTPLESANDYAEIVAKLPTGARVRLNLATAFDCPHVGRVHGDAVLVLLDRLATVTADVEIALCDTTGRADPKQVRDLLDRKSTRLNSSH